MAYNASYKPIIYILIRFIIILGFIQAIIGISQAILQHSVGIFLFKESLVSPNIDGVAKIVLFGHKFIRVYGLFPHPNIFGGFLLMSIVLTFVYGKIFYFDANKPKLSYKFKLFHVKQFEFLRNKILMYLILAIQIIALLLTFSKSAMLGLFCVVYYIGYKIVSHGTTTSVKKSIKNFWRYLIAIIIGLFLLTILGFNINSLLLKSFNERLVYLIVSCETIINNPIVGVGIGNFVSEMQKYSPVFLTDWQYQPVHNVFLLIWSELGIVGLVLFILFLWKIFDFNSIVSHETISKKKKRVVFRAIMFGFVIIMLFDHYFWDIQQGQIMLWMVLGFLAGSSLALSLKTTAS
jgi:O-antigen ligase